MQDVWIERLRCPVTGAPYDLDTTRSVASEVVEGFLVARGGREVRVVVAGVAILPVDLRAHLENHGAIYDRIPLADSRIVRFVLGQTGRASDDRVPFDEVVSRYGDLIPAGLDDDPPGLAPFDSSLAGLLAEAAPAGGVALDIGCGVGRGAFILRGYVDSVLGVDRSVARVRRARNVAVTRADFFLPAPPESGVREVAIELDRLDRDDVDFAVVDPEALPLIDDAFDLVVGRRADGLGPFADPAAVRAQAKRVLRPEGLLVLEEGMGQPTEGWRRVAEVGMFTAWRRS